VPTEHGVTVECLKGRHVGFLSPIALSRAGLAPSAPIAAFVKRLRCHRCGRSQGSATTGVVRDWLRGWLPAEAADSNEVDSPPTLGTAEAVGFGSILALCRSSQRPQGTQHFRARLAWVLRRPHNLTKPFYGDLKELLAIRGLWVRDVDKRHDTKLQIPRSICLLKIARD
jgi:hypothetical protein